MCLDSAWNDLECQWLGMTRILICAVYLFLLGLSSEFGQIPLGSIQISQIHLECVGEGKVLSLKQVQVIVIQGPKYLWNWAKISTICPILDFFFVYVEFCPVLSPCYGFSPISIVAKDSGHDHFDFRHPIVVFCQVQICSILESMEFSSSDHVCQQYLRLRLKAQGMLIDIFFLQGLSTISKWWWYDWSQAFYVAWAGWLPYDRKPFV